jgi:hypothetical protein
MSSPWTRASGQVGLGFIHSANIYQVLSMSRTLFVVCLCKDYVCEDVCGSWCLRECCQEW